MNGGQCGRERRLHNSRCRAAVLQGCGETPAVIARPGHGAIAVAEPVSYQWIVRPPAAEQRRAGGGFDRHRVVDQAAFGQEPGHLLLSAQQEAAGTEALPEAVDGRHGKQKVAESSGMQDDDRARHAI